MLQVTRNDEADELVNTIRSDSELSKTVAIGFVGLWENVQRGTAALGHDPSALLIPLATELLTTILELRIPHLRMYGRNEDSEELDALLHTAALYCVVDDLLQDYIADYTPMNRAGIVNPGRNRFQHVVARCAGVAMLCVTGFLGGALVELGVPFDFGPQKAVYGILVMFALLLSLCLAVRLLGGDKGCVWILLYFIGMPALLYLMGSAAQLFE